MPYAIINTIILSAIALIHFYWAFGGHWGGEAAVPATTTGKKVLNPNILATLIVAFGLCMMAMLHLNKVAIINLPLPAWLEQYALLIIAAIFLIRSIGDFNYVGFFKKVKGTKFATLDTKFYSPLCVLLSLNAVLTTI